VGGYLDAKDEGLLMATPIGNGTLGALCRYADANAPDGKAEAQIFEFLEPETPDINDFRERFLDRLKIANPKPGSAIVILGDMAGVLDGVLPRALNVEGAIPPVVHRAHPTRQ
jgi:hypothetical protein